MHTGFRIFVDDCSHVMRGVRISSGRNLLNPDIKEGTLHADNQSDLSGD